MDVDKDLERAIKELEELYSQAKKLKHVYNPIAYALYKVWRIEDSQYEKKVAKSLIDKINRGGGDKANHDGGSGHENICT